MNASSVVCSTFYYTTHHAEIIMHTWYILSSLYMQLKICACIGCGSLYSIDGNWKICYPHCMWRVPSEVSGFEDWEDWKKVTVSYDNMCHLNNLKVARRQLPLPGDLAHLWLDVNKIIDDLHIKNHRDPRCEQYRAPAEIGNTMSCEQTFAWLSRYKKILSAMPKTHHHFYLHRMVLRRNRYISQCYAEGRRPVQPKVRHTNSN